MFLLSILQAGPEIHGFFLPEWYAFFIGSLICWTYVGKVKERYLVGAFALMAIFARENVTLVIALSIYAVAKCNGLNTFLAGSIFQYMGRRS